VVEEEEIILELGDLEDPEELAALELVQHLEV
jgi:hypothetical protein